MGFLVSFAIPHLCAKTWTSTKTSTFSEEVSTVAVHNLSGLALKIEKVAGQ